MGFRGSEVQILSPRPISLQHLERVSFWLGRFISFDGRVFEVFWVGCQDMDMAKFHKTEREERLKVFETIKTVLQEEPNIVFTFLHESFLSEPSFRDIGAPGALIRALRGIFDPVTSLSKNQNASIHNLFSPLPMPPLAI